MITDTDEPYLGAPEYDVQVDIKRHYINVRTFTFTIEEILPILIDNFGILCHREIIVKIYGVQCCASYVLQLTLLTTDIMSL